MGETELRWGLRQLPREMDPPHDLWPGIAARLQAPRRRRHLAHERLDLFPHRPRLARLPVAVLQVPGRILLQPRQRVQIAQALQP